MRLERRQRWAAFSVKAHRNLAALATDILLYDRIILPVPEDEPEYDRWVSRHWDPAAVALRTVQAAGHIIPVPWTAELRTEWAARRDQLQDLEGEVAFGLTGMVYASYPPAWKEIVAGLAPDQLPERKPSILAGYQSHSEASAELQLRPYDQAQAAELTEPGRRPVDEAVALTVRRLVTEPEIANPEEAFLKAVELADSDQFNSARRNLFDLEDALYVDGWEPDEIEIKLASLEREYAAVVEDFSAYTRKRTVTTVLPTAVGWGMHLAGQPHLKAVVSKSIRVVLGRFATKPAIAPDEHPGQALHMIRAAYRE